MKIKQVFLVEKVVTDSNKNKIRILQGTFFTQRNAQHFARQLTNENSSGEWSYVYRREKHIPGRFNNTRYKNQRYKIAVPLFIFLMLLSSCQAIGAVFSSGMFIGGVVVLIILLILLYSVRKRR